MSEEVPTMEWLVSLGDAAEELCKEALELHRVKSHDTPFGSDAVNWGDIGCTDARWYKGRHGDGGAMVILSEAAPGGAYFFCQWIRERLEERGFKDVDVVTEW